MSTMGKEHASSSTKKTRYAVMCGKDFIVPSNASKGTCVPASYWKGHGGGMKQRLEPNMNNKSNSLTTVAKDNLVLEYEED